MKTKRIRLIASILLVLSTVILIGNTANYTRAALNIKSDPYISTLEMYDIGITLNENEKAIAHRDYLGDNEWDWVEDELLSHIENFRYGEDYEERLSVTNSGKIDTYVRVTIQRYWLDAEGNKDMTLDPSYIDLHFVNEDKWIRDAQYSYDPEKKIYHEQTVLYYTEPLKGMASAKDAKDRTTELFADTLTINGDIKKYYTQTREKDANGNTVVTNVYTYDGKKFCLKIKADAVQTHSPEQAILSAWGRKVKIDETTKKLSLEEEN